MSAERVRLDPEAQKAQKLIGRLHRPSRKWSADLIERSQARGGRYLTLGSEIPSLEDGTAVLTYPRPALLEDLPKYDRLFLPGYGMAEMTATLYKEGISTKLREQVLAGQKIAVINNHSRDVDPAILSNVLARGFRTVEEDLGVLPEEQQMVYRTGVMVNVAMDYLVFHGDPENPEPLPHVLRGYGYGVKSAPDTDNGHKYIKEPLWSDTNEQLGKELLQLMRKEENEEEEKGFLLIVNPSGTIDKVDESDPTKRKMHVVKSGTTSLLRRFDKILPIATEVALAPDGRRFIVHYMVGELVDVPKGKAHPKRETEIFVHGQMRRLASWSNLLTGGKPRVYYEMPKSLTPEEIKATSLFETKSLGGIALSNAIEIIEPLA